MRNDSERPIICCVTPGIYSPEGGHHRHIANLASAASEAGADWIQIREKDLPAASLLAVTQAVIQNARPNLSGTRVLVNDHLDVALAAGASGVHLPGESMPTSSVVRWCRNGNAPPDFLIGVSCHNLADAQAAETSGSNYIFFGPVFETPSKKGLDAPQGLEALATVCRAVSVPVIAIGGVGDATALECLRAGASGIAAIRLFEERPGSIEIAKLISGLHAFV